MPDVDYWKRFCGFSIIQKKLGFAILSLTSKDWVYLQY